MKNMIVIRDVNKILGKGFEENWTSRSEIEYDKEVLSVDENNLPEWVTKPRSEIEWDDVNKTVILKTELQKQTEADNVNIRLYIDEIIDVKLRLDKANEIDENVNHAVLTAYILQLTTDIQIKQADLQALIN